MPRLRKILVLFLITGILIPSLGPTIVYAQSDPTAALQKKLPTVSCGVPSIFSNLGECIAYFFAWIGFIWLRIVGLLLDVAGFVFNATLGVTIDNENYTATKIPALETGWKFSRDIVNIFFIFILLFIAIATILELESYGAKALLPRLIIIALFVNFSFLAAQGIIFISNALTVQLYEGISVQNSPTSVSPTANILSFRFKKDISAAVVQAFSPQALLAQVPAGLDVGGTLTTLLAIIEIAFLGSAIILAVAFLLLVESIFFITRLAILWILIILAPFGFIFLILPLTRGYATTWWRKLTDQAIFAPAFMFLLVLKIIIIQSGLSKFLGNVQQVKVPEFLFLLFLQASIIIILDIIALLVAKQLGVYGANTAIGWASKGGKWLGGYAGKVGLRRVAAPIAAGVGKRTTSLASIPVLRSIPRGAAVVSGRARKTYDEQAKAYTSLPPKERARALLASPPELQRAILDKTTGKIRELTLKEMGAEGAVSLGKNMKPFGLDKDVAKATNSAVQAMQIMHSDIDKTKEPERYQEEMNKWIEGLNNKELSQINNIEIETDVNVQKAIFGTVTPQRLNALLRNREQRDSVVKVIQEQTKDLIAKDAVAMKEWFRSKYGNKELADRINKDIASNLIAGTIKVRGETGGGAQEPPPAEEREET